MRATSPREKSSAGGIARNHMFFRYTAVGLLNTLVHWATFSICLSIFYLEQASSNLIAFLVAATGSFFINARFTFSKAPTGRRYFLFLLFMGALSFLFGLAAAHFGAPPLATLVLFSFTSLVLGFLYSRLVVFK